MWYSNYDELDYDKPIIAKRDENKILMLIPTLSRNETGSSENSYDIAGYNWIWIDSGCYNSCRSFKTVGDALKDYDGYVFKNIDLLELAKKEFIK